MESKEKFMELSLEAIEVLNEKELLLVKGGIRESPEITNEGTGCGCDIKNKGTGCGC